MTLENFSFELPTRIEFGSGVISKVSEEVQNLGGKKVLIVADKGVIGAGLVKPVESSLNAAGINYVIFDQIVPNPRDHDCEDGYRFAQEENVDEIGRAHV